MSADVKPSTSQIRGVNLGSWLLVEKWMLDPSISILAKFDGDSELEILRSNCLNKVREALHQHHNNYITEEDFAWLAKHGINSVRVPVGYWLFYDLMGEMFEGDPFYVYRDIYLDGHRYLTRTFNWGIKHGITILIDLHGLPGGQNDENHNGTSDKGLFWSNFEHFNRVFTRLVDRLYREYSSRPNYLGISLCNEPKCSIEELKRAIQCWDESFSHYRGWVILPQIWETNDRPSEYTSRYNYEGKFMIDSHLYYCFNQPELTMNDILGKVLPEREGEIKLCQRLIIGEWSLAVSQKCSDQNIRSYAASQIKCYEQASAWYFWSYKCRYSGWSFRASHIYLH